jgi:hypothetical protein
MMHGQQMEMNEQSMGVQRAKLALEAMNQPKFSPVHWTDFLGVQHAGSMDVHSGAITEAGQTAPTSGPGAPVPGSIQPTAPREGGVAPTGEPRVDQMFQQYPGTREEAEGILDGSKRMESIPARQRPAMEEAVRAVARQRGEKYDPTTLAYKTKFREEYNSGKSPEGKIRQSLETATTHLGDITQLNETIPSHSGFMGRNVYGPYEENWGHDPQRVKWQEMTQGLAGELAKLEGGGQGSDTDRKKWEERFSPDQPKEKRAAAISAAVRLMHGNLQGLEQQWDSNIGKTWKKTDVLSPRSRDTIEKANEVFFRGAKTAAQPIQVTTPAEAMRLPSGTRFIDPHGVERIRP